MTDRRGGVLRRRAARPLLPRKPDPLRGHCKARALGTAQREGGEEGSTKARSVEDSRVQSLLRCDGRVRGAPVDAMRVGRRRLRGAPSDSAFSAWSVGARWQTRRRARRRRRGGNNRDGGRCRPGSAGRRVDQHESFEGRGLKRLTGSLAQGCTGAERMSPGLSLGRKEVWFSRVASREGMQVSQDRSAAPLSDRSEGDCGVQTEKRPDIRAGLRGRAIPPPRSEPTRNPLTA